MIKFFRKIRQNLLMETGKTGKYFKYAIGEILLVMVGILLALQVNNWNENRKQHIQDLQFLETLRTELTLDTIALSQKISQYKNINLKLENTLGIFNTKTHITQNEYNLIADALRSLEVLTPINKNIQRNNLPLTNGMLMRIDNQLNQEYLNYLENTISHNNIISKLGESLQTIAIQDLSPHFDFTTQLMSLEDNSLIYDFEFNEIRNNRLIKNAVNKSLFYRTTYIKWSQEQKDSAAKLLLDIDGFLIKN